MSEGMQQSVRRMSDLLQMVDRRVSMPLVGNYALVLNKKIKFPVLRL